jgi:hypothetical protein
MQDKDLDKKIISPLIKIIIKKILPKLNKSGRLYYQIRMLITQYEKERKTSFLNNKENEK